jgi:ribosome-associated protein
MEHDKSYPLNSLQPLEEDTEKISRLAWTIAEAADDRKADDIVILKVTDISYLTDYFVLATGFSKVQVRAIADSINKKVQEEYNQEPLAVAGKNEGNWILQDYGDVIVHIFLPEEREFYNLEAFWGHAEKINFSSLSETARMN